MVQKRRFFAGSGRFRCRSTQGSRLKRKYSEKQEQSYSWKTNRGGKLLGHKKHPHIN
jgi:hypothetical protein